MARTIKGIGSLLQPLELTLRSKLIPALIAQPPVNDETWNLLALPYKLGGIAITNPIISASAKFNASIQITKPLTTTIVEQWVEYPYKVYCEQLETKRVVHKMR